MAKPPRMTSSACTRSERDRIPLTGPLLASVALVLMTLSACQMLPPSAPAGKPDAPPQTPPPVAESHVPTDAEREIQHLLAGAATALAADRLTAPPEDCAYYRYVRVLALDPGNADAGIGISDIVERYLNLALREAESRRFGRARHYLNSARSVDDSHPNIEAVTRQIEELERAHSTRYKLPPDGLESKSVAVAARLREIGREIARRGATIVITARSDSEGRWIYQQLNEVTGTRVRAQLQLGTPPSVELLSPTPGEAQP